MMLHTSNIFILIFFNFEVLESRLIVKPSESMVIRDLYQSFIALCSTDDNSIIEGWRSPSKLDVSENSRDRITIERKSNGLRLRIKNISEIDNGSWTCFGSDKSNKPLKTIFQLLVKVPIKFVGESIQYLKLDTSALLPCRISSKSPVEISWLKGEEKSNILSSSGSNYEQRTDGLFIKRVSKLDDDTFWCQADIVDTGESKAYPIRVIPSQEIRSTRIICLEPCGVEKRITTLVCNASGTPEPEYSWFYSKNIAIVGSSSSKFTVRGNRLMINHVDQTDYGQYTCHAVNKYDSKGEMVNFHLTIITPPVLSIISPIEINLQEKYISKQAIFKCHLVAGTIDQSFSLDWYLSNHQLVQSLNDESIEITRYHLDNSISLKFDPVRREHHGNYTCVAKNQADIASSVAQLFVQYPPIFIGPNITSVYSIPNRHVTIICQFDSSFQVSIQWFKIDELSVDRNENRIEVMEDEQVVEIVTSNINQTLIESKLIYNPSSDDFGLKFECRFESMQTIKHSFYLNVAEPPQPIRIIDVKTNTNSIELIVQTNVEFNNLPLIRYIANYEQVNVPNSLQTINWPVESIVSQSILIESLQVSTLYRIWVYGESQAGQSPSSVPIQVKTGLGQVPIIDIVSSKSLCDTPTSCSIEWAIVSTGGSDVSKIDISYKNISKNNYLNKWSKPIEISSTEKNYTLKNLNPSTKYLVLIRVFNKAGNSEEKFEITTRSCPKMKTNELCQPGCCREHKGNPIISVFIIAGIILAAVLIFVMCFVIVKLRLESSHRPEYHITQNEEPTPNN